MFYNSNKKSFQFWTLNSSSVFFSKQIRFSSFDRIMKIVGWVQPANFLGGQVPKSQLSSKEHIKYIKHINVTHLPSFPTHELNSIPQHNYTESKNIVETQINQFLELLYLESWRNIKNKKIFIRGDLDFYHFVSLSGISSFRWWKFEQESFTFKTHPMNTIIKSLIFFFMHSTSSGWFFNIHSRRLTAARQYAEIKFYFKMPIRTDFSYRVQTGLFLHYFLLNFKKTKYQPCMFNQFNKNIFMRYFYELNANKSLFEQNFTPEIIIKQFLLFLIPEHYIKGHYLVFYSIKRNLLLYLNLDENAFADPQFYSFLHNFIINFIYYKIYNFLTKKKANPIFNNYHFKKVDKKVIKNKYNTLFFQYEYPGHYWFYRFFFSSKLYSRSKILATKITFWEITFSNYIGITNYIPIKKLQNPYSFSESFSALVSRMSKKIWHGVFYYEYTFGKIRVRTLARWERERENDVQAQQRLEKLWYGFFWKYYPEDPGVLQMADDIYDIGNWKADKYDRLMAFVGFMQQSNRIQRKLRFDAQMSYVKSLRYGKRKYLFVRLSMKHWW